MLPPGFDPETGRLRNLNIPLPSGFDPSTGRLRNANSGRTANQTTNPSTRYTSKSRNWSLWDDFNDKVEDIGYWFAGWIDHACNIIMWIIIGSIWLSVIIGAITMFIQGSIIGGIISAIVGGVIAYYGAFIIGWIGWLSAAIVLYGLRFLFWNAWSLIIVLVLVAGLAIASSGILPGQAAGKGEQTEQSMTPTVTYRCTASSLNIRSAPTVHSSVIGSLKRGDRVEVYNTVDGFAHIKYQGADCYVSMEYLQKVP